jgi:hypothetical protein
MPTEAVADDPGTDAVILAEIIPAEEGSDHDPSEPTTDCADVVIPAVEVTDCPAKATVIVMTAVIVPAEQVADVPASSVVEVIAPEELVLDTPDIDSAFDVATAPTDEVADIPDIDSVLDGAIAPSDDVPVSPVIASIGIIEPVEPVAAIPVSAAVMPLEELTVPTAVVADMPTAPAVIPPTNVPAEVVDDNPDTGVICPNAPADDVALVPDSALVIA